MKTSNNRRLKKQNYRSFRLQKRIKQVHTPLPSARLLMLDSIKTLRTNWRFFGGVSLIYGLLLLVFVRGVGGGIDVVSTKDLINQSLGEGASNWSTSFNIFTDLAGGTSMSNNDLTSLYQTIIVIICSLVVIWGLRQVHTKGVKTLKAKDGFYNGMYPLVPVLLVVFVVALQFLPMTLAVSLYATTVGSGLAITAVEQLLWITLASLMTLLSLYMLASSIFAIYIATLPRMEPIQALRTARKLVAHRRFIVVRKLLLLPIVLMLLLGLIVIPFIAFVPVVAELVFFALSILLLPLGHAYIYNLYRSLL